MLTRKAAAATQKPMLWCLRDRGRGEGGDPVNRAVSLFMHPSMPVAGYLVQRTLGKIEIHFTNN
jgi:hypothetical protein